MKNIGATISLKDAGFKTGIKSAISSLGSFNKSTEGATSKLKKMHSQSKTSASGISSLAKKVTGVVAAYAGFNQVKGFVTDCVTGVMELERANTRLETLMMNVTGTTKAQVKGIIDYGDALEAVTTIEGDATVAGASQLATFQLSADTIKTVMPAFQDLAVAQYGVNVSQEQMIQSGNLIGKVMGGSVGALTKAGVSFTATQEKILKTGTESQKASTLVEVLGANFGGLAKQMAQTPEGKIRQLKNAWGSVKDEVGMAVMPAVTGVVNYISTRIPQIREAVTNAIGTISAAMPGIINKFKSGAQAIKNVADNWSWLGPIVYGVAGAIITYKSAVAACTVVETAMATATKIKHGLMIASTPITAAYTAIHGAMATGCGVATAAQMGLNAAMSANPVGVVLVGIGLLIAAGVALYKNWDVIKEKAAAIGNWISEKWDGIKNATKEKFNAVKDAIGGALEGAKSYAKGKLANIKQAFESHGGGIKGAAAAAMEGVKQYYSVGYDALNALTGGKLGNVVNGIKEKFNDIKSKAAEAWGGVKEKAGAALDAVKGYTSQKLGAVKASFDAHGGGLKGAAFAAMEGVKQYYSIGYDALNTITGGKLGNVVNCVREKLNSAKETASNILIGIKQVFFDKFEAVKNVVSSAIERIKGFFNFEWSLPKIKMPHFNITGSFSLNPPSTPHFDVSWYKNGGILTKPTIFGTGKNNLLGGGEAGDEAVLPLRPFWNRLDKKITEALSTKSAADIKMTLNFYGNKSDMNALADEVVGTVVPKLKLALQNI